MSHRATESSDSRTRSRFLSRTRLAAVGAALTLGVTVCTPLRAADVDNARDHFELGVKNYNSNKIDDALTEFQKAHELAPKEPTALFWIGFLYLQQRRYQDALQPTLDAVTLRPKMADGHLNLGNIYDGLKRYPDALKEFETAIKLEPKMPRLADAYYNMGSVDLKMERKPEAIAAFQKAAEIAPNDPYIQDGLGYAYQIMGNYAAAIPAHQAATRLAPTNSNFWLNLGMAQQSVAHKQLASKSLADRTAGQATLDAARISLAQALKLAPEDFTVRETYGEILFELKRDDNAAIVQFKKAVQLNPKDYKPLYNLALTQARLKHYEAAAEAYRSVLQLDPANLGALQGLGAMQYERKQYEESAKTFQKLTTLKPESVSGWTNYSLALENAGKSEEATEVLEEALKHVGNGAPTAPLRLALANHFYQKGTPADLIRARELYEQVAQADPNNANAFNGQGVVAQKERKYDEAITQFKRATALNPRFDDAFNNLGVAYEAKGDVTQAVANCRKALQINPNHKLAKDNLTRMTTKGAAPK